jgi:hypothetical protein
MSSVATRRRAIADFRKALSLDRTNQFARESLKRLGASAER